MEVVQQATDVQSLTLMCLLCIVQGHFQIVLSNQHCPLFQKDLSWFQRLMYCSGVWSYVVGAITAPMFIAIPLITIWAGVFPIVVSWWAAGVFSFLSSSVWKQVRMKSKMGLDAPLYLAFTKGCHEAGRQVLSLTF